MGTIASLPFLYTFACAGLNTSLTITIFLTIFFIAILAGNVAQQEFNQIDPQWIVIDETLGIFTAWFFRIDDSFFQLILLTIFFRFFDILKLWPASFFDKKVKNGFGIVMDDFVAGIMAGVTNFIFFKIYQIFA